MNTKTMEAVSSPSKIGDFWGGFAGMLVALPSAIAFGVLVYSGIGQNYVGMGAMTGIIGSGALGVLAALVGRTGGLISAPCAPAAAVLSAVVAELVRENGHQIPPEAIPGILALIVLISAGLQIFYGLVGCGRLIKFIPYPVVTGYMSAVGILIAIGQMPKLLGFSKSIPLLTGLTSPDLWSWPSLIVGLVAMIVMVTAPKVTKKVPAPVLGLFAGMAAYFGLSLIWKDLLILEGNSLIVGPIHTSGSFLDAVSSRASSLLTINLQSIKLVLVPAITLSILLSIDTLKTCVVLDALTRSRHHSDRELLAQGFGNLGAFLTGGMPGAGTMGPTLVNVSSGGRSPLSGTLAGIFSLLTFLFLLKGIAWVPIGGLAGILLVVAGRMIDKSMFHLLASPAGRQDFAVIVAVVLTALTVDLIAASGAGVALAILLFIRDQIKGTVIRRKLYLDKMSSKTRRPLDEREILNQQGSQAVFCELQGNLFFGTTDQLFSQLEPDLRSKRFVILDMRRVLSMDYTAAHLLKQMQAQLEERSGRLIFSGMPSGLHDRRNFEDYMAQLGIIDETEGILVSETLNDALEYAETEILTTAGGKHTVELKPLEMEEFDLFREFEKPDFKELADCIRELSIVKGGKLFSKGDSGDEIFLVRRGRVSILLPLESGKHHHLADIDRGSYLGELSFLDRRSRSADAEVKEDVELFALSREKFDKIVHSSTIVGIKVFARLALVIAERLRQTDIELEALEER